MKSCILAPLTALLMSSQSGNTMQGRRRIMSTGQQKAMYAGAFKSIRCHDERQLRTHLLICLHIVEHQHTQKAQTGEHVAEHNWVQQVQSAEVQLTQAERYRQVPHKACGRQDVCIRRAALLDSEHLGTCRRMGNSGGLRDRR